MTTVIHIGGNKTGSTLLQRHLFSKYERIGYLGEDCPNYNSIREALTSLVADDNSHYHHSGVEKVFRRYFSSCSPPNVNVYSNEDIMTSALPSVCANRLKLLLPEASVVMVIRNQLTALPSWYAGHGAYLKNVPRRYWRRHVTFSEWLEYCFAFPKTSAIEAMNYHRFYEIFTDLYGKENVHVLLYEELVNSPQIYFQRWADLLEIPLSEIQACVGSRTERVGKSSRRDLAERLYSLCFRRPLPVQEGSTSNMLVRWLNNGPKKEVSFPLNWREKVVEYYRRSNSQLAKQTGYNLAVEGYPSET